jgi:hypothetical protein
VNSVGAVCKVQHPVLHMKDLSLLDVWGITLHVFANRRICNQEFDVSTNTPVTFNWYLGLRKNAVVAEARQKAPRNASPCNACRLVRQSKQMYHQRLLYSCLWRPHCLQGRKMRKLPSLQEMLFGLRVLLKPLCPGTRWMLRYGILIRSPSDALLLTF